MEPGADTSAVSVESSFTTTAFSAVCLCLMTVGGAAALFGPLLSAIARRFQVSLPTAGSALSVYFVGGMLGVGIGWYVVHHFQGRNASLTGLATMVLGGSGVFVTAHLKLWTLFLLSVAFIGVGFGTLDFSLNTMLARSQEATRARRLSVANAFWGIGSILAPLVVIAVHPRNFPIIFLGVAMVSALLSPFFRGLHAPALKLETHRADKEERRRRRPILATFIAAYVLYVGLEIASSGWITSHLHGEGYSESVGALVTAGFWVGFSLGRFTGAALHRLFSAQQLVVGGLVLAAALCLVAVNKDLALVAYPLVGLAIANVYVFGIIWYQSLVGTDNHGVSILIVATMSGGALGPGIVGWIVSLTSVRAVPFCLAGLAALTAMAFVSSRRFAANYMAQSNS